MTPERLGPYLIDRELGSGGMGKVYAATTDRESAGVAPGVTVALKVVHPHLLEMQGFFKRFLREARIGRSVQHENVVRTFDCDAIGGAHFLVMEYVEGQTLAALQAELERVPEELCRHVGREICKGLVAIHGAGVVHRDLKPENVLITPEHVVKVMDLGVARLADEQMRLSQSGAFVGSVEYAAPEQFAGGDVDGRCDLHALGVLLYELSCGQHPYRGDDFRDVMHRVCNEPPRRLGDVHPQLSAFFEEIVHTLLAKRPEGRFASPEELLTVLEDGEESAWWHERAKAMRSATQRPLRRIRIPRETAVYGRDEELAKLRALFDQAAAGDGQVLLIEGEAGIGKSRLVDELIGRLQSEGEDLDFLFGSYPPGGAATASGAFSTAYREHLGAMGVADHLAETPVLVPAFDALLAGDAPPVGAEPLTKDSLQTCFVRVTRALAAQRVTVVLIDDLHFAPDEGRALFTALAMAVPGQRILLVGTTRPGVSGEWTAGLTRLEQTTRLELARLGPKEIVGLLRDAFGSKALADSLGLQIVLKSDGNPFFAFEILRGLREGRLITQTDDGSWISTQEIDEIDIPSSVLDLVNVRVAELSQEERDLVDVACCWGFDFDPLLIGEVVGVARIPLLKALSLIERKHRLVRSVGRRFAFDHHQVQEALYQGLPELLREEYHAALGAALEARTGAADTDPETLDGALCVDLCQQYLAGAQGPAALRYLSAAQKHLATVNMLAHVLALTEQALAVPGLLTGSRRAEVLVSLSAPLDTLGRRARQEECAREAEGLARDAADPALQTRAGVAVGSALFRTMHLDDARAQFEQVLALSRETGDRQGEADSICWLGNISFAQRRLDDACEQFERYLVLSRELDDRRGEAFTAGNLGLVFQLQGRAAEAREQKDRALELFRELGLRECEAQAELNLGHDCFSRGGHANARRHFERGLALSREIGYREGEALALHNLGAALRDAGDDRDAREQIEASLAVSRDIGDRRVAAHSLLALGSMRAVGGGAGAASDLLQQARDVAAEIGMAGVATLARCELACLPGGDAADAVAAFAERGDALDVDERREARFAMWRATGDRAHLDEAKRLLDEAVAIVDANARSEMLTNIRVNREIMAASRGGAPPPEPGDDKPRGTESATRAG